MKMLAARVISVILCAFLFSSSTHAWIGLIAESGDILNITKWNQLIGELDTKLEAGNVQSGTGITISTSGNDITISTNNQSTIGVNSTNITVNGGSCQIVNIPHTNFLNAYAEIVSTTPGNEIVPTGTIDADATSTGDANLINNNYTDLLYNNSSQGTTNKSLPGVDLGSSQNVGVVRVYWWNPNQYGVTDGQIQGSNDGTTWTPLVTNIVKTTGVTGDFDDYTVSGSYRYYRLFSVAGLNATWVVMAEMEVFDSVSSSSEFINIFNRDIEMRNNSGDIEICNNEPNPLSIEVNTLN